MIEVVHSNFFIYRHDHSRICGYCSGDKYTSYKYGDPFNQSIYSGSRTVSAAEICGQCNGTGSRTDREHDFKAMKAAGI